MNSEPPKPRQNPGHWLVKDSSDRRFSVAWALLCILFVVMFAAVVLTSRGA